MAQGNGSVRAVAHTGVRTFELVDLARPEIGDDDALVRVEACGICGTDVERYRGTMPMRYPVIPGHEPVGVIEELGGVAAERRGLKVGDRVAVDPFLPCARCSWCLDGNYELCTGWGRTRSYGSMSIDDAPGLWGGYATHLYAHPNTVLYPIPSTVEPARATLYNPLGAGLKWGVDLTGVTVGSTLLVLGCGQRGLACLIAARSAGARAVVVTGLSSDAHKLELARHFGAAAAVDVERENLRDVVLDLTNGVGVDAAVDTTPHAAEPILSALELVRPTGTVVLGGLKGHGIDAFPVDHVAMASLTIRGARGVGADAYRRAVALVADHALDLDLLRTHEVPLDQAERAVQILAGEIPGERPLNVVIRT